MIITTRERPNTICKDCAFHQSIPSPNGFNFHRCTEKASAYNQVTGEIYYPFCSVKNDGNCSSYAVFVPTPHIEKPVDKGLLARLLGRAMRSV